MVKLLKITGRVLGISLEWMLILLFFVAFAIRTASFQTYVAKKAASYLSEELGTKVKIDEVSIIFFDEVDLEGVLIMDQENDTLISTKTIHASIDDFTWSFDYFRVGSLELKEGYAQIKKSKKGILNTQFLKDYFKSDKPKKKRKIDLKVKRLLLSNVHFKYDDDRKLWSA